ncbi:MAG: TonB-dependent receptor, partial [Novosphingobium sp.]
TAFYAYSADELNGKETKPGPGVPTGVVTLPNYTYKNYGAQISGPIIKDTLFFMVAGERLRASRPLPQGPGDNNAGQAIPTLTQAQVDQISQIAKSAYNYDTGGVAKSDGDTDDRLVAKIDWNISSTQRASATYMYAKDSIINNTTNSFVTAPFGLSLLSNSYFQSNKLHTGVVQLNSDWTNKFSTELRGFYKNYVRGQDPVLGRGFAEMQVCTAPTSDRTDVGAAASANINCPSNFATVSFGPDISRQTNALRVKSWGGMLQGRLKLGEHDVKAFFEFSNTKSFNSFVQRSSGQYYFDSIADFQARTAQRFRYQTNPVSFNADDAAATFVYQAYTLGLQDTWRVSDALNVDLGVRYDFYGGSSRPVLNTIFASRYGFDNTRFVNGLGVVQPRLGFTFKPMRELSLRGGIGVFAGGTPDVYVSNSFSNTGVLTNAIDIQQLNNGTYNNASGGAILTSVNGATIPAAANAVLGAVALSPTAPTNALDPKFKMPRQLRTTLSADWTPERLGFLGSGWQLGADVLYSRVLQQVYFRDLRVQANGLLTPDGRTRYTPLTSFGDTNSDILLTNSTQGRGIFFVLRARKTFDFGLDAGVSYTHANVKDNNPATSSTASSNYGAGVSLDGNGPAYGIANDQVDNAIKFDFTYTHAFFGDNKTTLALFGESRTGHPYSLTMRDPAGRSTVFGVVNPGTGSQSRYLLYVPTGVSDPKVSFDNANNAALFDDYINRSGLSQYRGQIAPRNAFRSAWVTKIDLSISQEIPIIGRAKLKLFADIENFTNLLNKNWGQIREYAFPYAIAPVQVSCLTAPVATGTAPGTATAANAGQACAQYRYTPNQTAVVGGVTQFTDPTDAIYPNQSLYSIRIGVRFSF